METNPQPQPKTESDSDKCINYLLTFYQSYAPKANRFHIDGDGGIYDDFGVIDLERPRTL